MFRQSPSASQDGWISEYFSSRAAGAEFMLPWFMDTCFTALAHIKEVFTEPELKTIVNAHENVLLDTAHLRLAHLLLQVSERCGHGAELSALETKLRQLDDTEAAVLILWAASFWRGASRPEALPSSALAQNSPR